ncbi:MULTISPECIES: acyl-CoA thioesterase [Salinibaculum]|uniref:acyl-CoA thioesterase n=1 Tax=Salinibaculum TaxID=2732368 RepID=UPI0030CB03E4
MSDTPYTYETDVTVRFRDLDVMKQVHNAVVLQYVEEARVRYFRDVLDVDITEMNGAIARQEIDYAGPVTFDAAVTVRYRVASIGEASLTMAFEVVADGEVAASGEVVHVVLDEANEPTAVPSSWRMDIRDFEDVPVERS